MTRLIATTVSALALTLFATGTTRADHHGNCCCPCAPVVQSPCAPAQMAPPPPPAAGTTQQSQSVEPQAGPPAAPQTGVTSRSYSYQPVQTYQPTVRHRAPFDPEQRRQHPTSQIRW